VFGKAMAELIAGGNEADLPMPVTGVKPEAMRSLKAGFYRAAFSANQVLKSF
jgi:hypothetical protein